MIVAILLFWICNQLNAPLWCYIAIGIHVFVYIMAWGIRIGKSDKER